MSYAASHADSLSANFSFALDRLAPEQFWDAARMAARAFNKVAREQTILDELVGEKEKDASIINFVALRDDQVIGMAQSLSLVIRGSYALRRVCVDPDYQRHGVGRAMIGAIEGFLHASLMRDGGHILLQSEADEFYNALGYVFNGRYGGRSLMRKNFPPTINNTAAILPQILKAAVV